MTAQEIANLARKASRDRRLGNGAACALCGATNPPALMRVRRSLLERHHVAGRANDPDLTVVVCRNCHAVLTEGQRDVGADLSHSDRHPLEHIVAALRSLAAFFLDLGRRLAETADALANYLAAFDRDIPQWREVTP